MGRRYRASSRATALTAPPARSPTSNAAPAVARTTSSVVAGVDRLAVIELRNEARGRVDPDPGKHVLDRLPMDRRCSRGHAGRRRSRGGARASTSAARGRIRQLELRCRASGLESTRRRRRSPRSAPAAGRHRGGSRRCRPRHARRGRRQTDHRRPAAIAARLLHHVTSSSSRSSRNGTSTSIRIRRTNQMCSGVPQPVSCTSSIAMSWRKRAIASKRTRPLRSRSARPTRRRPVNVRPCAGIGIPGSST